MNGAHAKPWHEDNEDLDEHKGRQEDRELWGHSPDELGIASPRVAAKAHAAIHGDIGPLPGVSDEEAVAAFQEALQAQDSAPPPRPRLTIVVVGSFAWTNRGTGTDALHSIWREHGEPPVQLITSGCTGGAELFARELAEGFGWEVAAVRDESLSELPSALVFGFVVPKTLYEPVGVDELLKWLSHRYWTRIYREETHKQVSPWAKR